MAAIIEPAPHMITSRSIPSATWEQARSALIFYFSRRHGVGHAEDLAQQTLTTMWNRPDFEFKDQEDFLKVCYGFADNISKAAYRRRERQEQSSEGMDVPTPEGRGFARMSSVEMEVCLDQVLEVAKSRLKKHEWELIQSSLALDRSEMGDKLGISDPNALRVRLHRALRKLAKLMAQGKQQL